MKASEQYFKQVSEDLGAFAQHAGRKKIDESDVIAIMKRYVKSPYIFDIEQKSGTDAHPDNERCRPLQHHSF